MILDYIRTLTNATSHLNLALKQLEHEEFEETIFWISFTQIRPFLNREWGNQRYSNSSQVWDDELNRYLTWYEIYDIYMQHYRNAESKINELLTYKTEKEIETSIDTISVLLNEAKSSLDEAGCWLN